MTRSVLETDAFTWEKMNLVIDGVNEKVLRMVLLKLGKEVSSLLWINVLSFIHKILIFYRLSPNRP